MTTADRLARIDRLLADTAPVPGCFGTYYVALERADLLTLRDVCRRLEAALQARLEDYQCAQRCDGPHTDCPCTYCRGHAAIAELKGSAP